MKGSRTLKNSKEERIKIEESFPLEVRVRRKELREYLKLILGKLVKNFSDSQSLDPYEDYDEYLKLTKECRALIAEHDELVSELIV